MKEIYIYEINEDNDCYNDCYNCDKTEKKMYIFQDAQGHDVHPGCYCDECTEALRKSHEGVEYYYN